MPRSIAATETRKGAAPVESAATAGPAQKPERPQPIRSRFQVNDGRVLSAAAMAGHCIVLQPEAVLRDAMERGALVPVLTDYRVSERSMFLMFTAGRPQPPKLQALVNEVIKAFPPPTTRLSFDKAQHGRCGQARSLEIRPFCRCTCSEADQLLPAKSSRLLAPSLNDRDFHRHPPSGQQTSAADLSVPPRHRETSDDLKLLSAGAVASLE
jgi:hypothetical protein